MKNIKTFETINRFNIDQAIKFIVKPWISKLLLKKPVIHYESRLIYIRIYNGMNSSIIDYFVQFFDNLKKYDLKWDLRYSSECFEIVIDYSNIDKEKLNIEMSANKYNL